MKRKGPQNVSHSSVQRDAHKRCRCTFKATDGKVSSTPLQKRRGVPVLFKKHQSDSFKSLLPSYSLQVRTYQSEEKKRREKESVHFIILEKN